MKKTMVLDFGGTYLKYALIDDNLKLYHQSSIVTPNGSEDVFIDTVVGLYNQYKDEIKSIGISFCGKLDANTGVIVSSGQFPFLEGKSILYCLKKYISVDVYVENDGICALLAEHNYGVLKECENALIVVFGTGIGGGALLNGKIYKGNRNCAMELSLLRSYPYNSIHENWFLKGGGATGLLNLAKEKGLSHISNGIEFFELVSKQDSIALETLEQYCEICAIYLYNLQSIFDVEMIAIGGGISHQDILINKMDDKVKILFDKEAKYHFPPQKPIIKSCHFKNNTNLIGAYLTTILESY